MAFPGRGSRARPTRLASQPPGSDPATPALTVVVPTRDRPWLLPRCLEALVEQHVDGGLEVVVVDDHSRDVERVADAAGRFPGVRFVSSEGHGLAAARNAGVRAARSELVCFTDDDCVPDSDWTARLSERLGAGAGVVSGATVNGYPRSRLAAASQIAANAFVDDGARATMPPASNVGCRREIALAIGFDEGYVGVGAEERDWYARLAAAGHVVEFEPRAVVRHFQSLSLGGFVRRHVRYGRGAHRFRRDHCGGRLEPPAFYLGLLRRGFRAGVGTGFGVCLAEAATAVGFALEAAHARPRGRGA